MIRKRAEMTEEVRENMRGGTGAVTIQHCFSKDEFGAQVRLCARLILAPGASIGTHRHDGEDEIYVVMKGQGTLDDGAELTCVSEGDSILTGNGASHAIANDGDDVLELLAVIACY